MSFYFLNRLFFPVFSWFALFTSAFLRRYVVFGRGSVLIYDGSCLMALLPAFHCPRWLKNTSEDLSLPWRCFNVALSEPVSLSYLIFVTCSI